MSIGGSGPGSFGSFNIKTYGVFLKREVPQRFFLLVELIIVRELVLLAEADEGCGEFRKSGAFAPIFTTIVELQVCYFYPLP